MQETQKTTCKKPEKKKSCSDTCSDKKPFNPNNCGCQSHITKPHKVGRDGVPCPSETSVSSCKKTKNDKCSKKCKSAPTNSCTVNLCANDKDKVFDMKTCSKIKEKKKSLKNKVFSVKSCQDGECDDGGCKGSGSSCGKGGVKCAGISGVRYMSYASSRNDCDGCKQDDGDCNEEKSCKKKSGVFNASMMKSHDEENGECKATSKTSREKLEAAAKVDVLDNLGHVLSPDKDYIAEIEEYHKCKYTNNTYFSFHPTSFHDMVLHLKQFRGKPHIPLQQPTPEKKKNDARKDDQDEKDDGRKKKKGKKSKDGDD
ncbi:uncharacterized protein [Atheta coriaria]|uniref:uncharacterized protein n=1 Tax=Dalotia coriaria TaxID=877792 RepID=UPI0031F37493